MSRKGGNYTVKFLVDTAGATGAGLIIADYKVRQYYGKLFNKTDFDK